jgi:uncharacterized protein (DUF2062 family)/NAD(P)-dependent dehydrogenase (short-subunit alcohol dehydrogenase family)
MRVLVVIPVYNHAATLRAVAEAALREGHPVLVVDDGSTDGSLEAVAGLELHRLRGARNRGKGHALLAAAAWAERHGFDALLTLDADGQHDPSDCAALLAAAPAAWPAIIVGARIMAPDRTPGASRFGRAFSNFWVRLECGQRPEDTQSGFRLYPVAFLRSRRFFTRRYTFEIEVLVRAAWAGLPLRSVPVSVYYPPGAARISHFHQVWDNLRLTGLHTALIVRSLLPWPHRRLLPAPPRPVGVRARLRSALNQLTREHNSPGELAVAAGSGIFLGALPIMPFGLVTICYVHQKLHLNKLAGALASNLSIFPFVPFLCMETGHLLLHHHLWTAFNRTTLLYQLHHRLWEWLIGAMLIGPPLGAAGALLAYLGLRAGSRAGAGDSDQGPGG